MGVKVLGHVGNAEDKGQSRINRSDTEDRQLTVFSRSPTDKHLMRNGELI